MSPKGTTALWTKLPVAALFVDTGGFHAVADQSDRHHTAARAVFEARGEARRRAFRVVP